MYRLLRISELSGVPSGYTLSAGDFFHITTGTGNATETQSPSLSSVRMSLSEYSQWQNTTANTSVVWVSAAEAGTTGPGGYASCVPNTITVLNSNPSPTLSGLQVGDYVGGGGGERGGSVHIYNDMNVNSVSLGVSNRTNEYEDFTVNDQGQVGIGVRPTEMAGSTYMLDVSSAGLIRQRLSSRDSNAHAYINSTDIGTSALYYQNHGTSFFATKWDGNVNRFYFQPYNGGWKNSLEIDQNGKVGIGGNPDRFLHVYSGENVVSKFESETAGASLALQDPTSTDEANTIKVVGNEMTFFTATNQAVTIDNTQDVGIGATTVDARLHAKDSETEVARFESTTNPCWIQIKSSNGYAQIGSRGGSVELSPSGTPKFCVETDGKVGCGNNDPAVELDITGTGAIKIPGGTTAERPTSVQADGMIRYNSTLNKFEGYHTNDQAESSWCSLGGVSDTDQDTYLELHAADHTDDDTFHFFCGGDEQITLDDGNILPKTTNDVNFGSTGKRFTSGYFGTGGVHVAGTSTFDLGVTFNATCAFAKPSEPPFTCVSTSEKVQYLDADKLDGYHHSKFGATLANSGNILQLKNATGTVISDTAFIVAYAANAGTVGGFDPQLLFASVANTPDSTTETDFKAQDGTVLATHTVQYATNSTTVNGKNVNQHLQTSDTVQFKALGINTAAPATGNIRATSDITAFYSSSDMNLKKDVETISDALNIVNSIRGVRFKWNDNAKKINSDVTQESQVGVIAQEVEDYIPEVIKEGFDGHKAVRYENLTAVLIEAVKELSEKVKRLEDK